MGQMTDGTWWELEIGKDFTVALSSSEQGQARKADGQFHQSRAEQHGPGDRAQRQRARVKTVGPGDGATRRTSILQGRQKTSDGAVEGTSQCQ